MATATVNGQDFFYVGEGYGGVADLHFAGLEDRADVALALSMHRT